ncbi:MAG: Gfo/Idh/MocA family protein [Planctomycetota bacterium]|jgi:predicted dehydrogenase
MKSKLPVLGICVILFATIVGETACAIKPKSANQKDTSVSVLRVGVVGLVHGHVSDFLYPLSYRKDMQLVGVFESNRGLAKRYAEQHKLDSALFYSKLEEMLDKTKPQAVMVFTSTFEHRRVVEACAKRGIDVMMEKPLAVNMEHARAIKKAAREGSIDVLVNYQTTWYRSHQRAYSVVHKEKSIGDVRKIVYHAGHCGPKEIGCSEEFLEWLTDPLLNGGGALTDFGCYGANVITWLMEGQKPISVTAVTQQIKPEVYPKVDDEATVLLVYPKAQGIIQASWNWPFDRKDMEIYGRTGYVCTVQQQAVRLRVDDRAEKRISAEALKAPFDNPISYLAAMVRGQIEPTGLSSLENNMVVMEILDAARRSATTGKTIRLGRKN